ncbi:unnamed protein product [Cylindrotheca closterium]|uniref:Fe2OG dioxygenase domain-containing protein n=1 Tax=Cylindrotheca closterium TaxID=2856 RepID=A0AAD2PWF8_9STRA|nr:unnamed protein product [Cylindrotheca closterium]
MKNESSMELSRDGIRQLSLTSEEISIVKKAFHCASKTLDEIVAPNLCEHLIDPNQDSYSCSGYHPLGGTLSSKYNKYREGFVFSNGEIFDLQTDSNDHFGDTMRETGSVLHSLAMKAVAEVESTLGLPANYIQDTYGKDVSLAHSSQWHLKRYSASAGHDDGDLALGVHTDPSILSVVVHDSPTLEPGGWGLQYSQKLDGPRTDSGISIEWNEPPYHGHGVATVMIGSAFARIMQVGDNVSKNEKVRQLRRLYPPCRHRVVMSTDATEHLGRQRMALTYFLRPSPLSILTPLPIFLELNVRQPRKKLTFGSWYKKVSSNYSRSRAKTKQNSSILVAVDSY